MASHISENTFNNLPKPCMASGMISIKASICSATLMYVNISNVALSQLKTHHAQLPEMTMIWVARWIWHFTPPFSHQISQLVPV